jgi:mycothiol synthase
MVTDPSAPPPDTQAEPIWVKPLTDSSDADMAAVGMKRVRTLLQMRCDLPLPDSVLSATTPIETATFNRETDAEQFLSVNNRAFHWHPEQGGWDLAKLDSVLAEDWYDPAGFLLHKTDGKVGVVDGFCWTKVHPETESDPALGEIYAIAVDPDTHRRGLGRSLVVAGLSHLSSAGLGHGMLYVEHDNVAAVGLYERLGFWVHEEMGGYL